MDFIQAAHYTVTNGRQIDLVVIHDMEAAQDITTAENVANWFAGSSSPQASAHYCCDEDSTVQCVAEKDVAWHAPGANHNGIGIENAGYARMTEGEWMSDGSLKMLQEQTAPLVAYICDRYGIPRQYVDADGLLRGDRGWTTHLQVTNAFKQGNHWDPGYEFPIDQFTAWINGENATPAQSAPTDIADVSDNIGVGDSGPEVSAWQSILSGAGLAVGSSDGRPDGQFGKITETSTKEFQRRLGFSNGDVDGIVGPKTREATARLLAWLASVANTPVPAPEVPAADPATGIAEDGAMGPETVGAMQRALGVTADGIMGRDTISALQSRVGADVDGQLGPHTTQMLQAHIGATQDGAWGEETTRALQHALNAGTF